MKTRSQENDDDDGALKCMTCNLMTQGTFINCGTCGQYFHTQCQYVFVPDGEEIEWDCRSCVKALRTPIPERERNRNKDGMALESLKRQRDSTVRQLKAHANYIHCFDLDRNTVESLEGRIEMMELVSAEFTKIHREMHDYISPQDKAEIELADETYVNFSNDYCMVKGKARKLIAQSVKKAEQEDIMPEITKLPPVPIPNFSGDIKDWISFRDTFKAVVIDQRVSGAVKLHYLRESLKTGDAWKLISEIALSDDAFDVAWQTVVKRYDNKNVIVDSHVTELFKLRFISSDSAKDLWKLVENCAKHLKALESLGEPVEHWDTLIISLIKFRLDDVSKELWETKIIAMEDRPKWKDMESFLMDRSRVLDALQSGKRRSSSYKTSN